MRCGRELDGIINNNEGDKTMKKGRLPGSDGILVIG